MSKILLASLFFITTTAATAQNATISGIIKDKITRTTLPFVNIVLKTQEDSVFVTGTVTNEDGRFVLNSIKQGNYTVECSYLGYNTRKTSVFVGNLTTFLDVQTIEMTETTSELKTVVISGKPNEISEKMDKKTFSLQDNISQGGGSVLQAMQNLPSVTVQDGKVQLRGNDKVVVLIDGKQTALTGFGSQSGLDNIPASAIEKIEIINNPSAKYDANGNAGIINIIYKKNKKEGFNGKIGLTTGLGSLWLRKANLPDIRPQYTNTPKINPSVALNYQKGKINAFFQGDYLYTETLNKNEFVTRTYADGDIIQQQLKRNRNTYFATLKTGVDIAISANNSLTISGLFGTERIIDNGDQPFFNSNLTEKKRLWTFLEDELKTTAMATAAYQHKFKTAGHLLNIGFNYTYHSEDEKYFYTNALYNKGVLAQNGTDAFALLPIEEVYDFNLDYIKPLKYGRLESGIKFRKRDIPTNMQFKPGTNSVIDANAGGTANYKELIPALYSNYIIENKKWEAELGLRLEYVDLRYEVNEKHNTYKSSGYNYTQPFPNLRLAYKINENNKISAFFNRRVDRPNEVDIRIFPKYDDAEIIKVGNPALRPQFTNTIELAHKITWAKGSLYNALYHKMADGTISRIASTVSGSKLIYAIFQNVNKSYNTGLETVLAQEISKKYSFNANFNIYHNQIDAFSVENLYPTKNISTSEKRETVSGNLKINNTFHFAKQIDAQLTAIYLAPDLIPQGKIAERFSLDFGVKKAIQRGKGEIFLNATDLLNTMIIKKQVQANGFSYTSDDYYETQVVRLGYNYKF